MLLGRVVHKDVQRAEVVQRAGDCQLAEPLVADVARDRDTAAAVRFDEALRLSGVVVLVEVRDGNVGAFLGERDRDRATDPAVAPGDEGNLVLQPVAAFGIRIAVTGPRPHTALDPRLSLPLPRADLSFRLGLLRHRTIFSM